MTKQIPKKNLKRLIASEKQLFYYSFFYILILWILWKFYEKKQYHDAFFINAFYFENLE